MDSAVFCKSIFPFHKPGLSGLNVSIDPSPPSITPPAPHTPTNLPPLPLQVASAPMAPLLLPANNGLAPVDAPNPTHLVVCVCVPPVVPPPPPSPMQWLHGPADVEHPWTPPDMIKCPWTPPAVRSLTSNFEHHPSLGTPLPEKQHSQARQPSALSEANSSVEPDSIDIPLLDAIECTFITSGSMEPRTLANMLM